MLKTNFFIDEFLEGGLMRDTITCFYGPPASGKTTISLIYIVACLKEGKKVLYVDTEGGFSIERLKQLGGEELNLENLIVFKPKNFEDQKKIIASLSKEIKNGKTIGLVVIDSLVMLYRLKLGDEPQRTNTDLAQQLQQLTEVSRNFHIPILVTNQMYNDFETKESRMVGGMLIEYWSKTIIEIQKEQDVRKLILKKHKFEKEGKEINFEIKNDGIFPVKSKGFNFFKN